MLEAIRHRLTGWVAIAVLGIIGLSLVVSFGNMDSGVSPESVVADVNGEKISVGEYRQALDGQLRRYSEETGQEPNEIIRASLSASVLDGLINNRLLLQYVDDAGYRISDQAVAQSIRSIPAFIVDGEFSQNTYEALLLSQGLTPRRFEELQRRALETRQFQAAIAGTAFVTPSDYRRFLELEGESRNVDYVLFEGAAFEDKVAVDDSAVQEFYDLNAVNFMTEESVDVEFVQLRLAEISAGIEVSEEDLQQYYEENIDRFRSETERRSSHILISTDAASDDEALSLANDLLSRINAGEDFAALAQEFSDDPGSGANGGDLGWTTSGVFVAEFEAALFELSEGQVSLPVRTEFGYHLIRLDEIRPGAERPLADVRDALLAEVSRNEAEDLFYDSSERLDDLALESLDGLAPVAEDMGLELISVSGVTRGGAPGLPASPELLNTLYSLEVLEDGENTPLIEIEPGHVLVARVVQYNESEQLPLEAVRDGIRAQLTGEEAGRMAQLAGEAMLNQLAAGESFVGAAGANGGEVVSAASVLRGSQDVPRPVIVAVFSAPRPDGAPSVDSVQLPGGGLAVVQVNEVIPGSPEDIPRDLRDAQKRQLTSLVGQSQLAALIEYLRANAKVRILEENLVQSQDGVPGV